MDQIFVYRRHELLVHMKKYQEALMDINRSIQLVPENYQYHLVKAELLEKMQKYREALESLEEASRYVPDPDLLNQRKAMLLEKIK